MSKFTHWVDVSPSYDRLAKGGGVACCSFAFYCKGKKGAVYWEIGADWAIASVRKHLSKFPYRDDPRQPRGHRLGYHSREPLFDSQSAASECAIIGGPCYTDCSFCASDQLIEPFLAGGTAWLWPKLEEYYRHIFADGPYPFESDRP